MLNFILRARYASGPETAPEVTVQQLRKRNADAVAALSALNVPLAQVSVFLDRWVQTNFKTEGGKVGGWKSFRLGGRITRDGQIDTSAKLLQDTGRLRASFTPFSTEDTAGIYSDTSYAEKHEQGVGVPRRRMLPEKMDVIEDVRKIIKGHAARAIGLKP